MASDLGITPDLPAYVDLSEYMRRAREERSRAVAELFGFGFASAKAVVKAEAPKTQKAERPLALDLAIAKAA